MLSIRGHQRSSEAIRGHQRPSLWRTCDQRSSEAIGGHRRPSEAIGGHRRPSEAIRGHQRPSKVIRGHRRPSEAIRGHQWSSVVIRGHLAPVGILSMRALTARSTPSHVHSPAAAAAARTAAIRSSSKSLRKNGERQVRWERDKSAVSSSYRGYTNAKRRAEIGMPTTARSASLKVTSEKGDKANGTLAPSRLSERVSAAAPAPVPLAAAATELPAAAPGPSGASSSTKR